MRKKTFLRQTLDFRETSRCSVPVFDCRGWIHPLMSQNGNLSAVLADECSCTLGFVLRSVPTAGVVQQVLCVAANKTLAACNPEIKGKTELF